MTDRASELSELTPAGQAASAGIQQPCAALVNRQRLFLGNHLPIPQLTSRIGIARHVRCVSIRGFTRVVAYD